jgi:predicted RNA-binding Zn ribbon-like protein
MIGLDDWITRAPDDDGPPLEFEEEEPFDRYATDDLVDELASRADEWLDEQQADAREAQRENAA